MIVDREGKATQRCDCCGKFARGSDQFKQMVLPNRRWIVRQALIRRIPIPGELPPDWFKGIGTASHPEHPAQLHFCPSCERPVREAVFGGKIAALPAGPLKEVLTKMHHKALRGGR